MAHEPGSTTLCRLELVSGRREACPRVRCAFWEDGGAGPGGCAFERLDVADRPDFAEWLLGVRRALEAATVEEDADESRRHFYRRLNAGRAD
jgi:hypothetical protein